MLLTQDLGRKFLKSNIEFFSRQEQKQDTTRDGSGVVGCRQRQQARSEEMSSESRRAPSWKSSGKAIKFGSCDMKMSGEMDSLPLIMPSEQCLGGLRTSLTLPD